MFLGKVRIIIHQRAESQLKEVLDQKKKKKKFPLLRLHILHRSTVRTGSITSYYKNYLCNMLQAQVVFTFKLPQTFEEYMPIIQCSRAEYFCLLFSLLTGAICFKYAPVIDLLMGVYNPKGTVWVFLHKETVIYVYIYVCAYMLFLHLNRYTNLHIELTKS